MRAVDTPGSTSANTGTTSTVTSEISITEKPILGLRYLNKRTRVDILNFQVYVPPQSQQLQNYSDDYTYKLDRILPTETLDDLEDISEFNCINPEVIINNNTHECASNVAPRYTPKIRLIEKNEYYNKLYERLNISTLKTIGHGIDYCEFKFILSELKLQYKNAKNWHELVHIAIELPKIESQKIHLSEAQNLLDSGKSIRNFVSLPLLPKLVDAVSNCIKYIYEVDEFFRTIDTNPSPLESGNKLLQTGSQLPFITDQYILVKNIWESHIDRTHQINSAMYRNDYLRVAMLTQDDFKLNIPYIRQIYNDVKLVMWLEQVKKMLNKTPKYIDAVKILSANLNTPQISTNADKLELESRCIAAKQWLSNICNSPVSQLVIDGVKELVCDDNYRKSKHNKMDGEESLKYFTIFKDDILTLNPKLIDESNPFYNQDTLIQSLGGVDAIINSATNDPCSDSGTETNVINTAKPHPNELEKFYTQLSSIKLVIWCSKFLEPLAIKYRKFTRRFKRAIEGAMSKIEVVILLQDANLLSQQLQLDEQINQLKLILGQATEFENQCKQILDTRRSAISQFEAERLVEPWITLDNYRKQDIIHSDNIEQFISKYKPISGVDISAINEIIAKFDDQTIKNYPLMKELNDAQSIHTNWTEKMGQVLNDPCLSNGDLNRTIILLLDARKYGINLNIDPLLLNLKCYIMSSSLVKLIKTSNGDTDYALNILGDLQGDNRYMKKLTCYLGQMQFLDDLDAAKRQKRCLDLGIEHYLRCYNGM
ncbi:hypothetical protein BMR1_03g00576 [Babesia microti strain RI]|uniref:Uncharacterized protein n=1 Tax=Babesia microti (strain RI) TaxID=1133968 RepID=A0A1R4AB75_BABMR|nr:hypothetical protein BMR1_03g00576 [Babesia microti strain RI]SJK86256.1 hypothetical protein BMR1_03g00576 [Babesia microti strain RI]|eukprot:XP_012648727.2 hypothetical protein BMR1_03g00576 [Babesia microti strain RI]